MLPREAGQMGEASCRVLLAGLCQATQKMSEHKFDSVIPNENAEIPRASPCSPQGEGPTIDSVNYVDVTPRWGPPPPRPSAGRGQGIWAGRLRPFLDKPGEWGRVPGEFHRNVAHQLNTGAIAKPRGRWEFTTRSLPHGKCLLWARFLGAD